MVRVGMIDHGAGNIRSLRTAIERAGGEVDVITNPDAKYPGYVIPGVGNFDRVMPTMEAFRDSLTAVPVLGICIGMHVLHESSQEGVMPGLGVLPGNVVRIPDTEKVPHMGWNTIDVVSQSPLFDGVESDSWVYYMHSYMSVLVDDSVTAVSDYGGSIPAAVEKDNYFGTQFHPEKSKDTGRRVLENFLGVCRR